MLNLNNIMDYGGFDRAIKMHQIEWGLEEMDGQHKREIIKILVIKFII